MQKEKMKMVKISMSSGKIWMILMKMKQMGIIHKLSA